MGKKQGTALGVLAGAVAGDIIDVIVDTVTNSAPTAKGAIIGISAGAAVGGGIGYLASESSQANRRHEDTERGHELDNMQAPAPPIQPAPARTRH
jgi:hypothetical protein